MAIGSDVYESDTAAAALSFDGRVLTLQEVTVTRPGLSVRGGGNVTFGDGEPALDLTMTGSTDLASWQPAERGVGALGGQVDLQGRLTGTFASPMATFDVGGRTLAVSGIDIAAGRAAGRYEDGRIALDAYSANLAGGTVQGRGTIAAGTGESRVDARWSGIDARHVLGASNQIARFVAPNGSGELRWRASDGARLLPRVRARCDDRAGRLRTDDAPRRARARCRRTLAGGRLAG